MPTPHVRSSEQPGRRACGKRYFRDRFSAELAIAGIWRGSEDRGTPAPMGTYDCLICSGVASDLEEASARTSCVAGIARSRATWPIYRAERGQGAHLE
jgi:hypothetical protein